MLHQVSFQSYSPSLFKNQYWVLKIHSGSCRSHTQPNVLLGKRRSKQHGGHPRKERYRIRERLSDFCSNEK